MLSLQGKLVVSSPILIDPNFLKTVDLVAHHDDEGAMGLVLMPVDTEPEDLSIKPLRLFAGYSGWGAGQLEAELAEPSWIVVDAETDDAFADDPDQLWRTVLQRKGGPFSLM